MMGGGARADAGGVPVSGADVGVGGAAIVVATVPTTLSADADGLGDAAGVGVAMRV